MYDKVDDDSQGFRVTQTGADHGNTTAMTNLGIFTPRSGVAQDYVKAREWYEKAADKDERHDQPRRALRQRSGVAQDCQGARVDGKAADKGDACDQPRLLYANGQGVAQDYVKAREW